MALDHPDRVERLAVLDSVPTGEVWGRADAGFPRGYWHWAFLALPAPLPERLIGGDPQAFFDFHVRAGMGLGEEPGRYAARVLEAYRRTLDDPGAVAAMCGGPASRSLSRPARRTTRPTSAPTPGRCFPPTSSKSGSHWRR
jgi:haloacetate dehalogenase